MVMGQISKKFGDVSSFDLVIPEKWSIFVAMALLSLTRGFLPPIVSSLLGKNT